MRKGSITMIIAVDGGDDVEFERFGSGVQWVTMPRETYNKIVNFLEHPETGVRLGRLERKLDNDQGTAGDGGPGDPRRG